MTTPTPEELDAVTVDLIFALRSSLTDVSLLDFWAGRVTTAITTAAAGSEDAGQAITTAFRKLQIESPSIYCADGLKRIGRAIDVDYQAWASHVSRHIVYIVALAMTERDKHKIIKKSTEKTTATTEEIPF
ncbi:hypothetical protein FYJ43_04465 [Cutibacterium sp. WCA-380-WT-3A]|uniref:Uncharacterized protein n=1 Tax=Cutibacterium porci TaxID=2605781 RepID=A0A7K0J5T6_9ACTN|nr:hypothetical protein [Cutibacterium porci]MSS45311.1 hypothetical protein [Cutibacterium porci]